MRSLKEKVAYLQGLSKGLGVDDSSKEGKILTGIVEVLEEMADEIEYISANQDELEEYVESIDEDLYELEDDVLGDDDEIDMEDIDVENMVEVECSKCHETVCFDAEIMDDEDLIEVTCPNCDEVVFVNDQELPSNAVITAAAGTTVDSSDDDL